MQIGITHLKYYLTIFFFNLISVGFTQSYLFQNLTMTEGLSHPTVYEIDQDKYGFIWIGTGNGVNIYDGVHFSHLQFGEQNENSSYGNRVNDLILEGDTAWISTWSGLYEVDVKSRRTKRIDLGLHQNITKLYRDKKSSILWIGAETGLIKYDITKGKYQEFTTANSNISHDLVRSIYKDSDNNLWIGTFNGLNKLPNNSTVFSEHDLLGGYKTNIRNNLIMEIIPFEDLSDSLLWVGTQTGLVLFDRYTNNMEFYREESTNLINSVIKKIHKTTNGKLWIGTDLGLAEMDNSNSIVVHLHNPTAKTSIVNSTIWEIFEDNSGSIWIGTNNGISIISNSNERFKFHSIVYSNKNQTSGCEVRDIKLNSNGTFWLATQFGVFDYNPEEQFGDEIGKEQSLNADLLLKDVQSVLVDKKGRVWMATNGGVGIWNPLQKELKSYTSGSQSNNGLRTNYIRNIKELDDGTILLNTQEGLHKVIENENDIKFRFINSANIVESGREFLWSINANELIKINPTTFETEIEFSIKSRQDVKNIRSILLQDNSTIWLGCENGIIRYNLESKQLETFVIKSNKALPLISLLDDNSGNIWASSNSAILKFSTKTNEFEIYSSRDEIPITHFLKDCCCKTENGDLIFGGQDGFIMFSPDLVSKSNYKPPVVLTKLVISNKEVEPGVKIGKHEILEFPVSFTNEIELEYSQRSFSLEFSSLEYGKRDGIRYAYKLDPGDSDWNYFDEKYGIANFSNLSPEDYTFRLKGSNNDGVWNPIETTLSIKVKPPFWASPIFIIIYIVVIILTIAASVYYLLYRAKMINKLNIVTLEKEHTENIALIRQRFFTNSFHEFRTPLSLIIGPAEKLAQNASLDSSGKKFVSLIENNARRLLWLNNQLLDFRSLENKSIALSVSQFDLVEFTHKVFLLFNDKAEKKRINYSFSTELPEIIVKMDLRKIETILFNLLSNAFKFTPEDGQIAVLLNKVSSNNDDKSGKSVSITVKDSGIGIRKEEQSKIFNRFYQADEAIKMERGYGIGLSLVDEYVKIHNGKLVLNSTPQQGSVFQIILPLTLSAETGSTNILPIRDDKPILKAKETETVEEKDWNFSALPFVLVIEDEEEVANFILESFKGKYRVKIAKHGKNALELISKQTPDVVICDIVMPVMDGLEFTQEFKNNPKTSHIPLILLTGQSQKEKQLEGIKRGADAYMMKPFEVDLLEAKVENFLKGKDKLADYFKLQNMIKPHEKQIPSGDEKLLKKVVAYIENHITDPDLNVEKLCEDNGFSYSMLYRKIKSITGFTVNEFIRTIRIQRAEQLLRTKKFTVSEVMDETGFSHHSYFSKCFRKVYKKSPKEYIQNL